MDQDQFDAMTRTFTNFPSRRDVLRGLVGAGLGLGALRMADAVEAKKGKGKKKKQRKKSKKQQAPQPVINQFGCADVGQPCFGDSALCCSGVCAGAAPKQGKPDSRVCAAHDTGGCSVPGNRCISGDPLTALCNPLDEYASCLVTTGSAPFCGNLRGFDAAVHCQTCAKDTDCVALGFPPGSACVQMSGPLCNGCEATGNRACFPPAVPA